MGVPARARRWPCPRWRSGPTWWSGWRAAGRGRRPATSSPAHTASGVIERPMPWAAADEATPAGRSLQSVPAARGPGPRHEAEQPVHEHGAGGAGEGGGRAGEEHAQALADDPDAERPDERDGQRRAHRAPEQQADADEELDQREERVPHRDVGRDEVPDVRDEVAEDEGLPAGVGQDEVLDEALAEHEGLELQGRIEDPEQAEDDLERPLRADGEREAALLAPSGSSCLRARVAVHALLYATGGPPDCRVRAAVRAAARSGQLEVLGDAVGRRDRLGHRLSRSRCRRRRAQRR